ncbi:hypothetical protein QFC20_004120 [Naganishia adeliensis]|uniref:Uncharacterized protein n=1 Tax=Naganishia adeliensis TaxID=92952 RepID=A0ACC2W2X5_9TREE|nr:hypothetical protein QFC20_004120 [Naganishia adeliensis]
MYAPGTPTPTKRPTYSDVAKVKEGERHPALAAAALSRPIACGSPALLQHGGPQDSNNPRVLPPPASNQGVNARMGPMRSLSAYSLSTPVSSTSEALDKRINSSATPSGYDSMPMTPHWTSSPIAAVTHRGVPGPVNHPSSRADDVYWANYTRGTYATGEQSRAPPPSAYQVYNTYQPYEGGDFPKEDHLKKDYMAAGQDFKKPKSKSKGKAMKSTYRKKKVVGSTSSQPLAIPGEEDTTLIDTKSIDNKPKNDERVEFEYQDDIILTNILVQARREKSTTQAGFRESVYHTAATIMNGRKDRVGGTKDVKSCRNRLSYLRRQYWDPVSFLMKQSGAGWDEDFKLVTLPDEVWDDLEANPTHKNKVKFRYTTWPLYPIMTEILTGHTATGRHARIPGQKKVGKRPRDEDDKENEDPNTLSDVEEDSDEDDLDEGDDRENADKENADKENADAGAVKKLKTWFKPRELRKRPSAARVTKKQKTKSEVALENLGSMGENLLTLVQQKAARDFQTWDDKWKAMGEGKLDVAWAKFKEVKVDLDLSDATVETLEDFLFFDIESDRGKAYIESFLACPSDRISRFIERVLKVASGSDQGSWTG